MLWVDNWVDFDRGWQVNAERVSFLCKDPEGAYPLIVNLLARKACVPVLCRYHYHAIYIEIHLPALSGLHSAVGVSGQCGFALAPSLMFPIIVVVVAESLPL